MSPVRRRHEDALAVPRLDDVQGGEQAGGAGALGGREVRRVDVAAQVQGRGQDPGVQAIGVGQGGGAQVARVDLFLVQADQAVLGRGHGHRQAVFVMVAHGTFALGHADDRRGEPAHGLENRHPVQSQTGNVGAV